MCPCHANNYQMLRRISTIANDKPGLFGNEPW
jgi:hypothetical protein